MIVLPDSYSVTAHPPDGFLAVIRPVSRSVNCCPITMLRWPFVPTTGNRARAIGNATSEVRCRHHPMVRKLCRLVLLRLAEAR